MYILVAEATPKTVTSPRRTIETFIAVLYCTNTNTNTDTLLICYTNIRY